jgi:hypothetical protein
MSVPWPTHRAKARAAKAYVTYLERKRRVERRTSAKQKAAKAEVTAP